MQNRRNSIEPSRTSVERSCQAGLLCLLLTAAWAAAGRDGVTGVFTGAVMSLARLLSGFLKGF